MKRELRMRWKFSLVGCVLLAYFGLLCLAAFLCEGVFSIDSGWGYLGAAVVVILALFAWKWTGCSVSQVCKGEKSMRASTFAVLCCLVLSCQFVFQLYSWIVVAFLGEYGAKILNSATSAGSGLPMSLYVWVLAPVVEELVFRLFLQRKLIGYGKAFGIFCSAFLFAAFHINPVQIPFAFFMGLVLGYVAAEYSVLWAMGLHVFNNLVLGGLIGLVHPAWLEQLIYFALTWGGGIAGIWILVKNGRKWFAEWKDESVDRWSFAVFITSPGILLLLAIMILNMVLFVL